jgi:acyl-coenzyme A thioesterase PaaI-like protein
MGVGAVKHELTEVEVTGLQPVSSMCLVCGEQNTLGLHTHFFELADGGVCALFEALEEHQSYPGRVHGGIISAILDETIGRAVQVEHPEVFGVTMELQVKFRLPVPLGVPLRVVAHLTKSTGMIFEGEGLLLLEDGSVAAQATARYAKQPTESIAQGGLTEQSWHPDTRERPKSVWV